MSRSSLSSYEREEICRVIRIYREFVQEYRAKLSARPQEAPDQIYHYRRMMEKYLDILRGIREVTKIARWH